MDTAEFFNRTAKAASLHAIVIIFPVSEWLVTLVQSLITGRGIKNHFDPTLAGYLLIGVIYALLIVPLWKYVRSLPAKIALSIAIAYAFCFLWRIHDIQLGYFNGLDYFLASGVDAAACSLAAILSEWNSSRIAEAVKP